LRFSCDEQIGRSCYKFPELEEEGKKAEDELIAYFEYTDVSEIDYVERYDAWVPAYDNFDSSE